MDPLLQKYLRTLDLYGKCFTFSATRSPHPVCKHSLNLVAQILYIFFALILNYIRLPLGPRTLLGILMDVSGTLVCRRAFLPAQTQLALFATLLVTMQLFCNRLTFRNVKHDQLTAVTLLPSSFTICPPPPHTHPPPPSFFSSHFMDCLYKSVSSYMFNFFL